MKQSIKPFIAYTLNELESLPTLSVGQADNLKVDTGTVRVWLSRCTVEDGEPYNNKVTIERLIDGYWFAWHTYQAQKPYAERLRESRKALASEVESFLDELSEMTGGA